LACQDRAFQALLVRRYAEFVSDALPQVSLRVEILEASAKKGVALQTGPFAQFGGRDGVLTIKGEDFRGEFDEQSGMGWIASPPDPSPLETFLTGICAGRLLREDGFLLHAAAILAGEEAFVFFGPSGSGKTTVAELIGKGVITDEIAGIRRDGASYRISSAPWRGQRLSAPLGGLFRLRKAQQTAFAPLSPSQAVRQLLPCVFFPCADAWEVDRFLEIAKDLLRRVPCYEMSFTPDGSFWEALPGRRTEELICSRTMRG
jgi:hypothetical protein